MLIWSSIDLFEVTSSWLYVYYAHTGYGIGFDSCSAFSLPDGSMGKSAIIFGTDIGSFLHINIRKKDIFILGEGPIQVLDDTTLTAELNILLTLHN